MHPLIAAALEENPVTFKREFETLMQSRREELIAQSRVEIGQSIRVDGEEDTK